MQVGILADDEMLKGPLDRRRARLEQVAQVGLDYVFVADHISFYTGFGMDGLIQAATAAALEPNLDIHIGVYLLALRHPVPVARQISSLCESAPGRLVLGVGVGGEDRHEIWMLPGNEISLRQHLMKYIITEDVEVTRGSSDEDSVVVVGQDTSGSADTWQDDAETDSRLTRLNVSWNDQALTFCSGSTDEVANFRQSLSEATSGDAMSFERLRIAARFPLVGQDLTENHLAPEALRNATAISYTKGCYLGQEPIARLDALGQVNRALALVEISEDAASADNAADLTSADGLSAGCIGLAVVRAKHLSAGSTAVRLSDGGVRTARIIEPTSLS